MRPTQVPSWLLSTLCKISGMCCGRRSRCCNSTRPPDADSSGRRENRWIRKRQLKVAAMEKEALHNQNEMEAGFSKKGATEIDRLGREITRLTSEKDELKSKKDKLMVELQDIKNASPPATATQATYPPPVGSGVPPGMQYRSPLPSHAQMLGQYSPSVAPLGMAASQCGVALVHVRVSSSSSGLSRLSRGFVFSSSAQLRRRVPSLPGPLYSGLPQSSPSLSLGCSMASPTAESSTTTGQVHPWGSNPLSSLLSRRRGSTLTHSPGQSVCRLPLRPSPNENPTFSWQWWVLSGLPAS